MGRTETAGFPDDVRGAERCRFPRRGAAAAWAQAPPRLYARTRLVDVHGRPIAPQRSAADTNYVFQYPYRGDAVPAGQAVPAATAAGVNLKREDGADYAWHGGVGAERNVVAFSAICAHKLAYPTREVSFIRYPARALGDVRRAGDPLLRRSQRLRSGAGRAVSSRARRRSRSPRSCSSTTPARTRCTRSARGVPSSSTRSSTKYKLKLAPRVRQGKARQRVAVHGHIDQLRELTNYCRTTIQC